MGYLFLLQFLQNRAICIPFSRFPATYIKCTMLRLWFSVWLILISAVPGIGQLSDSIRKKTPTYFLVLQTNHRRIKFYAGSQISFKLHDEQKRYTGRIQKINKRSLVFWDTEIALRDIHKIKTESRSRSGKALAGVGALLRGAGGLFTLVGGANYVLVSENRQDGKVTCLAGLSSYVAGRALQGFRKRTYKINKNRRLKTYDL